MSIIKECEYCGCEYEAQRDSAKYCCRSCNTLACRARKAEEIQNVIDLANQKAYFKKERKLFEERKASLEKLNADLIARRK